MVFQGTRLADLEAIAKKVSFGQIRMDVFKILSRGGEFDKKRFKKDVERFNVRVTIISQNTEMTCSIEGETFLDQFPATTSLPVRTST